MHVPHAHAGDMSATCPSRLGSSATKPGAPVADWITTPQQMHLEAAGMSFGPPESEKYNIPVENTKTRQVFVFDKGDGQRWFWCGYGGAQLSRRLDDRATRCTITYKTKRPENNLSATVLCE